jgi:seryl-tRNA synthetase
MLDIKFVRESPDLVRENLKQRGDLDKIPWIDQVLESDIRWRSLQTEVNNLRSKRNKLTEEIAKLRRQGADASELVKQAEQLPEQMKNLENETQELNRKITEVLMQLPNIIHESVPFGKDDSGNVEVRKWGEPRKFDFESKDHIDLTTRLGLVDWESAAKVAGARFYYLRGDLVMLNYALAKFALDFMEKKGFTLIQPPYLLRREAIGGPLHYRTSRM